MDDLFFNPERIGRLIGDLLPRIRAAKPDDSRASAALNGPAPGFDAGEYEVKGGVAVIPVRGGLVSAQIPGWDTYAETTYESLVATIEKAVADPSAQKILLAMNSPGGTVTGCAEAAARIDALSKEKPIWSSCSMADSAAYWLAAATNKIIVDPTGEVGSIGVIMTHMDISQLLENFGVKMTHIFSGDRKADGSPFQPLSEEAMARMKGDLDHLRGIFVGSVAALRNMDTAQVQKTQALTYKGQKAVDAGLADETGFFNDVLNMMAARPGASIFPQTIKTKEKSMAKTTEANKTAPEQKAAVETPAAAAVETAAAAPAAAAELSPAVDQKARIAAIIDHPEAQGRTDLAKELAFGTDMSPEAAGKLLAKAPKTEARADNALAAAMKAQGSAKIGAGGGEKSGENTLLADMSRRFAKK